MSEADTLLNRIEAKIEKVESLYNEVKFDLETARVQRDNAETKLRRIGEVYHTLVNATETFEHKNIGANVAYLLGAMATESFAGFAEWHRSPRNADWWALLDATFPKDHFVWGHIRELKE